MARKLGALGVWRYRGGMDASLDRITVEPGKAGGGPCIRGMRVRVQDIVQMLAAGMTAAEILMEYPYLETDDLRAAMAYAAER